MTANASIRHWLTLTRCDRANQPPLDVPFLLHSFKNTILRPCQFLNGNPVSYELWVSPATGYRRRGTRVADLRSLFEEGLTTKVLYEPLRCCELDDLPDSVRAEMNRLGFDVVGVVEGEKRTPLGYVTARDLERRSCREALHRFGKNELIPDSTSLLSLLENLGSSDRRFVTVRGRVRGIVTRADLQKPPVRILLFGLISLLEMHLTYWVRTAYKDGNNDWARLLKVERIEAADRILQLRNERNEAISLFDCIQFCDKRDLALGNDEIREQMKLGSKQAGARVLRAAERLRDRLAHSQGDVVGPDSWSDVARLIAGVVSCLNASDNAIEKRVAQNGPKEPGFGFAI